MFFLQVVLFIITKNSLSFPLRYKFYKYILNKFLAFQVTIGN